MELQNISIIKTHKNIYNVFHTLGSERKANYDLLDRSLTTIKNEIENLENYISPKAKLIKKLIRKKRRINTIFRHKRILRNNSSNISNLKNNSSLSLDSSFKNKFKMLLKKEEKKAINKKINNSRNCNLNINKKNNDIFITDVRMKSMENDKNPINKLYESGQNTNRIQNNKTMSLKKFLPPIKNKISISTSNNNIKTIDKQISSLNKIINENNKNTLGYIKTENPMLKKVNKFLYFDEKNVLKMMLKNKKIKGKINSIKNKFDNKMVNLEAKYKYLNWKYGIADMNKYFIDIDTYKKDSAELIDNKKSFYDKLDDMVDVILKEKQLKEMSNIKKQYGININKKKEENEKDKDKEIMDEADKLFLKGKKIKNILRELYQRKKVEKEKRDKIENILSRTQDKYNIIYKNLNTYRIKEMKYKEEEK